MGLEGPRGSRGRPTGSHGGQGVDQEGPKGSRVGRQGLRGSTQHGGLVSLMIF